jgi:hypothetical protein
MLLTRHTAGQEETEMDSDYMFLCGVMWCRFGQPEAGKELVRAATSMDPDMRALAWAMLANGALRLRIDAKQLVICSRTWIIKKESKTPPLAEV